MAIFPLPSAYGDHGAPNPTVPQPINIEAWTEQATQALNDVALSSNDVRGASRSLAIDLDEKVAQNVGGERPSIYRPRREPMRRDSLKRREALLRGKEGSRRRTRWENDHLLNNPWAQTPLPSDWEVHPTYPKHAVPYYLAPLWDHDMAAHAAAEKERRDTARQRAQALDESSGKIPRELREKLKKAKAAKGLLKDLEEQVRFFVVKWENQAKEERKRQAELDSDDEEIVFVGRNGQMSDWLPKSKTGMERDRLIFDSLANDRGASFGRWLVHSIASYYGLHTWSITVGDPARREAYVGVPPTHPSDRAVLPILPRPLWGMV